MVQLSDIILSVYASQASEIKGFGEEFRWLSNFFEIEPFEYQGIEYKTTENFYQSMKTFDREVRIHIAGLSPGKAKRFASQKKTILFSVKTGVILNYSLWNMLFEKSFRKKNVKNYYYPQEIYTSKKLTIGMILFLDAP